MFDTTQITSPGNVSSPKPGDPCHPIAAGAHAPCIAFDCKAGGDTSFSIGPVPGTLRGEGHGGGHLAVAIGCDTYNGSLSGSAVRRLTPRECERLQGFPDDYTRIPWRAYQAFAKRPNTFDQSFEAWLIEHTGRGLRQPTPNDCPDGPRYRVIGNSMAVPVMRWIGERIAMVDARTDAEAIAA